MSHLTVNLLACPKKKYLLIMFSSVIALISACSEQQSLKPPFQIAESLQFIRQIQITTAEEGGGARPEIVLLDNKFFTIYLAVDLPNSFKVKVYDRNFNFTGIEKKLIETDNDGSPTDIRIATDGLYIYMAYQKNNQSQSNLFLVKYDKSLTLQKKILVVSGTRTETLEWTDDPIIYYVDGHLYLITKTSYKETGYNFKIRKYDTVLNEVAAPIQIALDLPRMFGSGDVASVLYWNNSFYLVTTSAVEGTTPLAPAPDETTNIDLVVFELNADWTPSGWNKLIVSSPDIEFKPTGFKYVNGKFYLTYIRTNVNVNYPQIGQTGPQVIGAIYLKVFDSDFNQIQAIKVIHENFLAEHPTIEIIKNKVFVASGITSANNVYVNEYQIGRTIFSLEETK